ncbi:hypothetical protein BASA81_003261 [Batrachochytrium salamandrivorans]|nr:hypothetical protein BASA81_003261 [Batrachochytrium salamandrivorans]
MLLHSALEGLEEIEALEQGLVEELESIQRKTHRSKLAQECRIANSLKHASDLAKRIKFTHPPQGGFPEFLKQVQELGHDDGDEEEEEEEARTRARIAAWGGREIPCSTEEEARLVFRPKNRAERRQARSKIDSFVIDTTCSFTGEETLGKFLDLHEFHLEFQNLAPGLGQVSYLDYLRKYVAILPPPGVEPAASPAYCQYIRKLGDHLVGFELRARPLTKSSKLEPRFALELERASAPKDLLGLSMDELKLALADRGLKVGGTLQQRADRLFQVKGLSPQDFPPNLTGNSTGAVLLPVDRETDLVKQTLARLQTIVSATITMITKKLIMTYEEIEHENKEHMLEEAERSDAEEEEDDENQAEFGSTTTLLQQNNGKIDPSTGRLIPKWMYRLHGLNHEFRCEICGDQAYFGRRAYERHFKDFRHANGMKALGIPNTAHFLDITKIDDAVRLHQSLKADAERNEQHRKSEEFEDDQGNVLSRKTYEDLRREGLL